MAERVFGEIPGVSVGAVFTDRRALHDAGVHRPLQGGISGSGLEGADSIVLSGGYEDDIDLGDEIVYTGHGGKDLKTGKQVADQQLTVGNLALVKNRVEGLPVRVVRGADVGSAFAPASGYRYDGLYYVVDHWSEPGRSGYLVWRYRLRRDDSSPPPWAPAESAPALTPARKTSTIQRIVRNTETTSRVKALHDHRCQVCGVRLETPGGPYAEGAHVRPLGRPHDGPDTTDNILVLCPNHHVLFDVGAFAIAEDLTLLGLEGRLAVVKNHRISPVHLAYHRDRVWSAGRPTRSRSRRSEEAAEAAPVGMPLTGHPR